MKTNQFKVRRTIAIVAFAVLVAMVPATFVMIAVGEEHMGEKLLQGSSLLAPVSGFLTAVVWKYYSSVSKTEIKEIRKEIDDAKPDTDRGSS